MLNKNVADIKFKDVEDFCKQNIPENAWLDYKQSISHTKANEQIKKVISSLANAHGGWVIFGISETKDPIGRGLPNQFVGIEAKEKPGEKVQQVCINEIDPPVIPEFAWCELDDPNKAGTGVLVVRVHGSDSAPHQLGDGEVRIRVNDVSYIKQEGKQASVGEIEMLLNRRQKSAELKKRILSRAQTRTRPSSGEAELCVYCLPKYPDRPLTDFAGLSAFGPSLVFYKPAFIGATRFLPAHESLIGSFNRNDSNSVDDSTVELGLHGLIHLNTVIQQDKVVHDASVLNLLHSFFGDVSIVVEI